MTDYPTLKARLALAEAARRVALGLTQEDVVEVHEVGREVANITFSSPEVRRVLLLTLYTDGTYSVGSSTTLATESSLGVLEAYRRGLKFIQYYGLLPRTTAAGSAVEEIREELGEPQMEFARSLVRPGDTWEEKPSVLRPGTQLLSVVFCLQDTTVMQFQIFPAPTGLFLGGTFRIVYSSGCVVQGNFSEWAAVVDRARQLVTALRLTPIPEGS